MTNQPDPRMAELLELAREEGITLPMSAAAIVAYERRGKIVDLETGQVYNAVIVTPTPSAKAVTHLLQECEGEMTL